MRQQSEAHHTLVTTDWLGTNIQVPDVRIFDASWHLPDEKRDAKAEYAQAHIPGALFFDIDAISDTSSDLPHMAPSADRFAECVGEMGLRPNDQVVIYDSRGIFSAARAWWLFRLMGHNKVAVLDGGLPKWLSEARATTSGAPTISNEQIEMHFQPESVRNFGEVLQASKTGSHVIVDARAPARFRGEAPEPRPGLRAGHIPNARNVFYKDLLNKDGTMKAASDLHKVFEQAGVDIEKPIITSCGSGVTAAILSLALERIGKTEHSLYDGSWAEWGLRHDLPIATGDA